MRRVVQRLRLPGAAGSDALVVQLGDSALEAALDKTRTTLPISVSYALLCLCAYFIFNCDLLLQDIYKLAI